MPVQTRPSWPRLYETAMHQDGLFTTRQAIAAGFSRPLLAHHLEHGRLERIQRGLYRVVHFPRGDHEALVVAWLWSDRAGVLSHTTALMQHDLSDVLPVQIHLTLPSTWDGRRLRVPAGIVLHHGDIPPEDRGWFGVVPITGVRRTLNDCARHGLSPELLQQAAAQALRRGLVTREDLGDVAAALAPYGGLP